MQHRRTRNVLACASAVVLVAGMLQPAAAQRRFGGGVHAAGGGLHNRAPMNFHGPGSGGAGVQRPVPARPPNAGPPHTGSGTVPHPSGAGPRPPGPGPQPPGPGPHPPGPGPHPPGPGPHPPGPGPYPPGPGPHPPGPYPGPHPPPPPPPPPGWGYGWGWDDDPLWDAAAAGLVAGTAAAVVANAARPSTTVIVESPGVGSVVYALPGECAKIIRGSVTYFNCNNIWYQPQYLSSGVSYVIVTPPK